MGKLFTTGIVTDGSAAANGLALINKLRDDVVAHPAWDLVEEYTPGGGAVTWYVFRCLAAGSGLPYNFYMVFGRLIATGELRAFLCEGYDAGTHTASGYGSMNASGTAVTYDSEGRQPFTQVLGTPFPTGTNRPRMQEWIPSSASTNWWTIVDDDAVVFTTSVGATFPAMFDLGTYIPLGPVSNPMPLVSNGAWTNTYGITRNPVVAGLASIATAVVANGWGGNSGFGSHTYLGFKGRLDTVDKLQGDKIPAAEGAIQLDVWTTSVTTVGQVLGKHKRMRVFQESSHPAAFSPFNDSFAFNGTLWMAHKSGDPRLWDTGVAV